MSATQDVELSAPTRQPSDGIQGAQAAVGSVAATILYHPELHRVGEVALLLDQGGEAEAGLSRSAPSFRRPDGSRTDALRAAELSRSPLLVRGEAGKIILVASAGMEVVVEGERLTGARKLSIEDLDHGVVVTLARTVAILLHNVEVGVGDPDTLGMVGHSRRMNELRREVLRVADRDIPVLLRGETGVGKELVASAIHSRSMRRDKPYVCVNLAAVPSTIAEAELFGYGKGAFTGATSARAGYFEEADGGTLFLDEVGDTPMDIQAKLLRVTQDRVIQPLGRGPRKVDVRLIAATDSDLESAVDRGSFRRPLLERLGGYRIRVPSLRERRDDIPRLFLHFLREELSNLNELDQRMSSAVPGRPWLPLSFMLALVSYAWPGNVRELANIARQIAISNRGAPRFRVNDELRALFGRGETRARVHSYTESENAQNLVLPPPSQVVAPDLGVLATKPARRDRKVARELSDDDLVRSLRDHNFKIERTAAALGISKTTLYAKMAASPRLRKAADLSRAEIAMTLESCNGDVALAAGRLKVSDRALVLRMRQLALRK